MSKSFIYCVNSNSQSVLADGVVSPGNVVRRFGCNLALNGDALSVSGDGYYAIDANIVAAPVAEGEITATLYADGVAIPGATATVTAAAAGDTVVLPIIGAMRKSCCCNGSSTITCVLSAAATVVNFAMRAERE